MNFRLISTIVHFLGRHHRGYPAQSRCVPASAPCDSPEIVVAEIELRLSNKFRRLGARGATSLLRDIGELHFAGL